MQAETRIAYFGDTVGEVEALLSAWETRWAQTSVVAEAEGSITGFLGAEIDESLQRAWLHGPAIVGSDWDDIADQLLAELYAEAPQIRTMLQDVGHRRTPERVD